MKNIKKILREGVLIAENVKQAEKLLKNANIELDNPQYLALKDKLVQNNHVGLLGPIVKMARTDKGGIKLEDLDDIYGYIQQHQPILNLLPKPIHQYETGVELAQGISVAEIEHYKRKFAKNISNSKVKKELMLSDWKPWDSNILRIKKFLNYMSAEEQEGFWVNSSKYKDFESLMDALRGYMVQVEDDFFYLSRLKEAQNMGKEHARVLHSDPQDEILLLEIKTYEASTKLGLSIWCIVSDENDFDNYTHNGEYNQYFFYDFRMETPFKKQAIAFTMAPNLKVVTAMDRHNSSFSNVLKHISGVGIDISLLQFKDKKDFFDEYPFTDESIKKGLRSKLIMSENVKQAEKLLKQRNLGLDNEVYIEFKNRLIQDNKVGLLGPIIRMCLERHPILYDGELNHIYSIIMDNQNIINRLPKPIHQYESRFELFQDIIATQTNSIVKKFAKKLSNTKLRNELESLGYDRMNDRVKEMDYLLHEMTPEEQRGFWAVSSRYDALRPLFVSLNAFVHKHRTGFTFKDVLNKIQDQGDGAEIVYRDDEKELLVVHVKSFGASCNIGTKSWCISEDKNKWEEYSRNGAQQFFVFNFQPLKQNYQMLAFTANKYGNIIYSFDKNNTELDNGEAALKKMGIDWRSLWEKMDLEINTVGDLKKEFYSLLGPVEVDEVEDIDGGVNFEFEDTERQRVFGVYYDNPDVGKFFISQALYDFYIIKTKTSDEQAQEVIRSFVIDHLPFTSGSNFVIRKMD